MLIDRELKGQELLFTVMIMLLGEEGVDFCYYSGDASFWRDRLYLRRN